VFLPSGGAKFGIGFLSISCGNTVGELGILKVLLSSSSPSSLFSLSSYSSSIPNSCLINGKRRFEGMMSV
jgi:hypothetical protein